MDLRLTEVGNVFVEIFGEGKRALFPRKQFFLRSRWVKVEIYLVVVASVTLPETNSLHLKIDPWKFGDSS